MTKRESGRLGGLATFEKHGREHMQAIGRKGFKALCCRFPGNSRRLALHHLHRKGIVQARYIPHQPTPAEDAAVAEMYREFGLEADPDASEELPF
jgi:hypothetical protein